jgi:hypothetical protein
METFSVKEPREFAVPVNWVCTVESQIFSVKMTLVPGMAGRREAERN